MVTKLIWDGGILSNDNGKSKTKASKLTKELVTKITMVTKITNG